MSRLKKIAVAFIAIVLIFCSAVIISEREETRTVVLYAVFVVLSMLSLLFITVLPFQKTFIIENTNKGIATIGGNAIKRLIYKTIDKKSVKSLECSIKKIPPNSMEIRIVAGISTTTNAMEFIDEVQNEVATEVEDYTGLEVSRVDVHIWYYNKGKK